MKYSILGFNQAKVIETDLDLTDLVILQYIQQACGATGMNHKLDSNGNPQVWVNHQKLISDLPILRISEGTLRNRLASLNQRGYIRSTVVANEGGRGSRTYYGITEMTMSLIYDTVERPCHEKMTSDNRLINNIVNTNTNVLVDEKPKKKNLFNKCTDYNMQYTNNVVLQDALNRFLNLRLEMSRTDGKPFYYNMWPPIVNALDLLAKDTETAVKIVNQSIEKGWKKFYPLKTYSSSAVKTLPTEVNVVSDKKSDEELNLSDEVF